MRYVRSDIAAMKGDIKALATELNAFGGPRTEMTHVIGGLRADMIEGFQSIRTSIEQLKLWMLVTVVGPVILNTFVTLGCVLRWF